MPYDVDPFAIIEQGIAIFPTDPGDKRPVARDKRQHPVNQNWEYTVPRISWSQEATTDPAQIERWISEYRDCRWGVPTGDVNGFFAVDIDGPRGDDWWNEKWFPEGSDVATPSGGRHIRYSVDPGEEIQTNKGKIHPEVDVRGEGGYIVAYTSDFKDIPEAPESVLEIIPRRGDHSEPEETIDFSEVEIPTEASEAEKRVLKGITDALDALPRPWRKGAGYHDVQFRAACHLHRIANSPFYATDEDAAHALFLKHAPIRDKSHAHLREERWISAKKQTQGQIAEHPGDTPVRLEVDDELLSKFADSEIDRLFWESKKIGEVKRLIQALRLKGATPQEAYSISYDSAAMKHIRKANAGSSSTWGFVVKEYENPDQSEQIEEEWGSKVETRKSSRNVPVPLLTDAERDVARHYPNFIDNYIDTALHLYAEPNLPLHYVNAWIALSVSIGDRGAIYEKKGRTPLSLWGLNLAPTAAGKTDANEHMRNVVDAIRPGGFSSVDLGDDASAQQLIEVVMDRPGRTTGIFMDECREFLSSSKQPGSYHNLMLGAALKLYDGRASRALRKGMDKDKIGETVNASFTLWMQGAWKRVIEIMDESDIESGFVGRFLVAVGGEANVTRESLTPEIASEYQVENGGRHPLVDSFCASVNRSVYGYGAPDFSRIDFANSEVKNRYVDMRVALDRFADSHKLSEHLRGVLLRVGVNMLKGAALLAISEGRTMIEMEDLLVAMKSGEYWVKGSVELAEAVSASQYRRLVDHAVSLIASKPRTEAALLRAPRFQNMRRFEVVEILERAEKEGRIHSVKGTWEVVE